MVFRRLSKPFLGLQCNANFMNTPRWDSTVHCEHGEGEVSAWVTITHFLVSYLDLLASSPCSIMQSWKHLLSNPDLG